jgi:hypothetical protein
MWVRIAVRTAETIAYRPALDRPPVPGFLAVAGLMALMALLAITAGQSVVQQAWAEMRQTATGLR